MTQAGLLELMRYARFQAEKLRSSELSREYRIQTVLKRVINETVTVKQFEKLYPVIKEASYKLTNRNDS